MVSVCSLRTAVNLGPHPAPLPSPAPPDAADDSRTQVPAITGTCAVGVGALRARDASDSNSGRYMAKSPRVGRPFVRVDGHRLPRTFWRAGCSPAREGTQVDH